MERHLEASRALASGEALRALSLVGRVDDGLGLLLRGVAYAQLGDLEEAERALECSIAIANEPRTAARARAAQVEILLERGDARRAAASAAASARELAALDDERNAAMQRLVHARAEVLLGRLGEARAIVAQVLAKAPPDVAAVAALARAEIAMRSLAATEAETALDDVSRSLSDHPHRLLERATFGMRAELRAHVAKLHQGGSVVACDAFAIERACSGELFLVDACRRLAIAGRSEVPLTRRPVLFALLERLAHEHPRPVARDDLARHAFATRVVNASHRARLRVELGRLRKLIADLGAAPVAQADGYALASQRPVAVLAPPSEDFGARIALLLADGAAWSAQRVAEHAGISKRTAQRALAELVEKGAAVRTGAAGQTRYTRPGTKIASRMLLLGLVPKP